MIPTNRPLIRIEHPDVIYRTEPEKWRRGGRGDRRSAGSGPAGPGRHGLHREVREALRPCCASAGIKHVVLNAKYHEMEAEIVAQAGRIGAVTIATNMAGRGTDILLGGNPEFLARQALAERGIKHGDTPAEEWEAAYAAGLEPSGGLQGRARQGRRAGRPAHHRHRAARVPPHRQPAARPRRAARATRGVPLLPLAWTTT